MKKRTDMQMQTATKLGVGFCTFVYLFSSIIAVILFSKEKIIDTVLENFEQTMNNPNTSFTIHVIMVVVLVCFLISATMSIPLIFFSFKYTVLNLILFLKKNLSNKNATNKNVIDYSEIKEENSNDEDSKNNISKNDRKEKLIGDSDNDNIDKLTVNYIEANFENNKEKESKRNAKLSDCEEKIWTFFCYVSIVILTLIIEKLEIVFGI